MEFADEKTICGNIRLTYERGIEKSIPVEGTQSSVNDMLDQIYAKMGEHTEYEHHDDKSFRAGRTYIIDQYGYKHCVNAMKLLDVCFLEN